jgi:DNA-directed RNA polymerase specialized sigma subunit
MNPVKPYHEITQPEIAEKLFLSINTIARTEKKAIENFKKILAEKGIKIEDLL